MNEAIGHENHAEKNLIIGKKNYCYEGHARCKDSILSKSVRFCESMRRKRIEFTVLRLFFSIYRTVYPL
jgi:hypothetical protein